MTGLRIRAARADDAADLLVLKRDAILAISHEAYDADHLAAWAPDGRDLAAFETALDGDEYEVRVAERAGDIVGYGVLNRASGTIDAVFVDPAHTRSGVGRQLVGVLETTASVTGLDALSVAASLNAESFYARLGYESVERATRTFDDVSLPVVRMRTSLDPN